MDSPEDGKKWVPVFEFDSNTGSLTGILYEWEPSFESEEFSTEKASVIVQLAGIDPTKNKEGQWVPSRRCERWRRFILFASAYAMDHAIAQARDVCDDISNELCWSLLADDEDGDDEEGKERPYQESMLIAQMKDDANAISEMVDEINEILREGARCVYDQIPFDEDGEEGEE